jgi:hypothetical protein
MIAKLYECPESIANMEIAFEQKAMQVISRIPARREAEKRVSEVLDALAVLAGLDRDQRGATTTQSWPQPVSSRCNP